MNADDAVPRAGKGSPVWLRVGTLLDGDAGPVRDAHVVYDADLIRYVGPADRPPPAELLRPGQRGPDWHSPASTLLPGLTEAHAHLFLEGGELDADRRAAHLKRPPQDLLADAEPRLGRLIDWGVVAVRDAGDRNGVGLALRRRYLEPARPPLSYLDSPGAAIHHRGRYGGFMGDPLEDHATARDCVAARVAAGADRIKLIPTGIINFRKGAVTSAPQMSAGRIADFVGAAKAFGKQTMAHASGDAGIDHVIDGGVASIEHGFFVRDDQLAKMRDKEMAWVPTFAPVQEQVDHADRMGWDAQVVANLTKILDAHAVSLAKAHAMGVHVIAGSDAGSYGVAHGLGFIYELELMQRAGLSPLAVINSATGAGSELLAFKENFGQIRAGFLSRLIITRHSPLDGIANLRKERFVVFDGAVFATGEKVDASGL